MDEFIDYMHSFYGVAGLYPMGITTEEIIIATGKRLERYPKVEFTGDTVDRETVWDIILENRSKDND